MTKYILVGGYFPKAPDNGKAFLVELIKGHNKPVKILDCLYARPKELWDKLFLEDKEFFSKFIPKEDFEMQLANIKKFIEQVKWADVIFLKGGTTKDLMESLNKTPNWTNYLDNKTLAGTSAGADVISKYYGVGKTGRVNGVGLGLLPIKFIPHWKSNSSQYLNANWENILEGLKNYKEDLPIYTLAEGEFKVFTE